MVGAKIFYGKKISVAAGLVAVTRPETTSPSIKEEIYLSDYLKTSILTADDRETQTPPPAM